MGSRFSHCKRIFRGGRHRDFLARCRPAFRHRYILTCAAVMRPFARLVWTLVLQAIHSCSPCWLSSGTSTSVRVSWPSDWHRNGTTGYSVTCTSTPDCGTVVVNRTTYSATVSGLTAATYYRFRVTDVNGQASSHRYCSGTTSLYHSVSTKPSCK